MKKILIAIIAFGLIGAYLIFFGKAERRKNLGNRTAQTIIDSSDKKADTADRQLQVSGWLPYWSKASGAASLANNLSVFDEIHPFAFEVNADGSLRDTLKIKNDPWPQLQADANRGKVSIVPTILWGDAAGMHKVFSDPNLLARHIESISDMLEANSFYGVDIDYEGKDVADRDLFSSFLQKLHIKLRAENKSLNCTVEARTQDAVPDGWSGTRAMAFANDFRVLGAECDSVTIMAYDQVFQTNGIKDKFESLEETVSAPNADKRWVEEVTKYSLRYIAQDKLVLGVPTYGWEFKVDKLPAGYRYTRVRSVVYLTALAEARKAGAQAKRTAGGEESFTYSAADGQHVVTFADADSVRQEIQLAERYNLKGICLFKLDGMADPGIFEVLRGLAKSK